MDDTSRPCPDAFDALLQWIEAHLDEPLTLDGIARRAGWSPYHVSRLFTARMGRSVMAHVRGRRLVNGARRLCVDPGLTLADLAFDCGFESQEAFTRAFKRVFGVAPGRFRAGHSLGPLGPLGPLDALERRCPMNARSPDTTASVVRLPDLVRIDAFTVAGPTRRFDPETQAEIPRLWSALVAALPLQNQRPAWTTYGVVWSADRDAGSFRYLAGVAVEPGGALPPGFERQEIPAATYAVFRIVLDGSAVHPQVKSAMAAIWGTLIPASGLKVIDGPDFERYDGRFAPDVPGTVIDFYVPVEAGPDIA